MGFGTWQSEGPDAKSSVETAINDGYRHIDTAQGYHNEAEVGAGITASGINRDDLFITTKIDNNNHGYELTKESFEQSLSDLGTDYVNLLLIHWPNPIKFRENWAEANAETWHAMEEIYQAGKAKAIGVSNFRPKHLKELAKTASVAPMVDQIFLAPGVLQPETVSYCQENNIQLEAYSPLGTGDIFKSRDMSTIAQRYHKSISQVALRWSLQHGFLPLPKSTNPQHIQENTDIFDFELNKEDMAKIDKIKGLKDKIADPDTVEF
ncbi:hypothetical protein IV38_GL001257 [Lactobacillus selangorensis]|uniref:NADP-dependent oxidoreductase domain-containing protein n=1 Tax=Lactobacillus selangorensis TaxID=81857 RepID=A0A0R2FK84_9LACO|nr:hypothetical protein IV38_GL001257 [Lactobacillus selangorensis]KRN30045.1 hypothetical protein IV40_GL002074 [Lactobacillus selangorensis]